MGLQSSPIPGNKPRQKAGYLNMLTNTPTLENIQLFKLNGLQGLVVTFQTVVRNTMLSKSRLAKQFSLSASDAVTTGKGVSSSAFRKDLGLTRASIFSLMTKERYE